MNWFTILVCILWCYGLSVLKRGKLHFWYFCTGSIGLFLFFMLWIQPIATVPLTEGVAAVSGIIGQLFGLFQSYFQHGLIFIQHNTESISLYINYECSGIIEIMAYLSLLFFFPVYRAYEKIVVGLLGVLYIFSANVLRILLISIMIQHWGNNIYYVAHTIFGRLVFYTLSAILYFYVFTKAQIIRQKVGSFRYETH